MEHSSDHDCKGSAGVTSKLMALTCALGQLASAQQDAALVQSFQEHLSTSLRKQPSGQPIAGLLQCCHEGQILRFGYTRPGRRRTAVVWPPTGSDTLFGVTHTSSSEVKERRTASGKNQAAEGKRKEAP